MFPSNGLVLSIKSKPLINSKVNVALESGSVAFNSPTKVPIGWFSGMTKRAVEWRLVGGVLICWKQTRKPV